MHLHVNDTSIQDMKTKGQGHDKVKLNIFLI